MSNNRQPTAENAVIVRRLDIFELPLAAPLDAAGGRIQSAAGELTQIVSGPAFRHLAYLEFRVEPPKARGNHYHRQKVEYLYLIGGRLRLTYKQMETGAGDTLIIETGDLVTLPPYWAHAMVPLVYSQALEFASVPFDPSDTYRYILEAML